MSTISDIVRGNSQLGRLALSDVAEEAGEIQTATELRDDWLPQAEAGDGFFSLDRSWMLNASTVAGRNDSVLDTDFPWLPAGDGQGAGVTSECLTSDAVVLGADGHGDGYGNAQGGGQGVGDKDDNRYSAAMIGILEAVAGLFQDEPLLGQYDVVAERIRDLIQGTLPANTSVVGAEIDGDIINLTIQHSPPVNYVELTLSVEPEGQDEERAVDDNNRNAGESEPPTSPTGPV